MTDNSRYVGKPFLRLLELYVLRAINELPLAQQQILERLAPKFQKLYGGDGEWFESIARAMHMSPDMPVAIRELWVRNLEIARVNGATLSPQEFAEMIVDENFAPEQPPSG